MQATIKYTLSAAGQKAALLANKGGEASRTDTIEVPADALDLFGVKPDGTLIANFSNRNFDSIPDAAEFIRAVREAAEARARAQAEDRERQAIRFAEQKARQEATLAADIEAMKAIAESGETGGYGDRVIKVDPPFAQVRIVENYGTYRYYQPEGDIADLVIQILAIGKREAEEKEAEKRTEEAHKALLAKIPAGPIVRAGKILPDGKISVEIPVAPQGKDWGKKIDSIDTSKNNGSAFEGNWLKNGLWYNLDAGDLIVTGATWETGSRRNTEYHKSRDLYVVTPAGLICLADNSPAKAVEYLNLTPAERAVKALTTRLETCEKRIEKFKALDRGELAAVLETVDERLAAWETERDRIAAALEVASAEPAITTVEQAAAAIVAAGYRALAAKHHPDKGGTVEEMSLINRAKAELAELIKLAQATA